MKERIVDIPTIVKCIETSPMCPAQWDLWDEDGTYYYVRFRSGSLTITRDEVMGPYILTKDCGKPPRPSFDGYMDLEEMIEHAYPVLSFSQVCEYTKGDPW